LELHSNTGAHFTKWVVSVGLLKAPFVVIDVGVQGGESERWHALSYQLVLHGFNAIGTAHRVAAAPDPLAAAFDPALHIGYDQGLLVPDKSH
jgi:hypothetical protein